MRSVTWSILLSVLAACLCSSDSPVAAQGWSLRDNPELAAFFRAEVDKLEKQNELTRFESLADWQDAQPKLREQLFDMLGLSPRPGKTPLQSATTFTTEETEFLVERVDFQSAPGLYVTGNFYRPRNADTPLPTILYVCGHGQVKKDGISFGNKTHYHYHGAWFARNGYNCLIIDTLQLGEIEGIHHGTYKLNRWWWNSRGYTPAGVEAWNCIRALDYLETRPEVDAKRIGVTGRSGGGAYSWWIAALDERIQCAVPVAGITSLRDHVVNGCVEGHCDCMYMVNTFRWDYATVAALVAPRPLLISNTDKDTIFPLEGVVDIHRQVRHIYRLYDAGDNFGLQITEGPHKDTQELHIHAFRWFNRFLKNDASLIEKTAIKYFQPEQLKVFAQLPTDEINTQIDETFVPVAKPFSAREILENQEELLGASITKLKDRCFRGWTADDADAMVSDAVDVTRISRIGENDIVRLSFESQPHVRLTIDVALEEGKELRDLQSIELAVEMDHLPTDRTMASELSLTEATAVMAPRGFGPAAWAGNEAKQIQIQRRFQLLGMTADGMRVWDIRRAIQIIRQECPKLKEFHVRAGGRAVSMVMLASLFEPPLTRMIFSDLSVDRDQQPSILNLTRTIPMEILPILASAHTEIVTAAATNDAKLAAEVTQSAEWNGKKIVFRP